MNRVRVMYSALFALATLIGASSATLFTQGLSPLKKVLGIETSHLAREENASQCIDTAAKKDVYFVSCGGLF